MWTEWLKDIAFIILFGGLLVVCWFATRLIASRFFKRKLDWLATLAWALPAAGIIGWIVFTIYFYININY